jgi:hypothetical protein
VNALLTLGGLIMAMFITTLITSESAHHTTRVDPYETKEDWTLERAWQLGLVPLGVILIGVSLLVLVAS